MIRAPGTSAWVYIIPGSGQPRLPSDQVTSSELTSVTRAASTLSRLARSALACSTGPPGGVLLLVGLGVIEGVPPVPVPFPVSVPVLSPVLLPQATKRQAVASTTLTVRITITSHSRRRNTCIRCRCIARMLFRFRFPPVSRRPEGSGELGNRPFCLPHGQGALHVCRSS